MDTMDTFVNHLANLYTSQFNVYRDKTIGSTTFAFTAEHYRKDEKYLMTKAIKVWGVENQQFVFLKKQEKAVTVQDLKHLKGEVDRQITSYTPDKKDHMSSVFLGVIVTDQPVDPAIRKEVKRGRKLLFLKYGWHGWAERYLVIVDLREKQVLVNKKGRVFVKGIEDTLNMEVE
ncbi:hypothetical protein MM300_07045 [Evansella sp. LMS18]|uniref:hypothetical protein n=1 Tax=Evansella sp. LMS18 TaxID=2924033 RepID=UPI0020D197F8|nr:hypothetical protein [Evansella sp. LMS18]UTR12041.1 hypothetical protein MM300_07045 [Evansella sp. LMS18]